MTNTTPPIVVETFPWKNGMRIEGTCEGKHVTTLFVRNRDEFTTYLGHIETVHGKPVQYGWGE